MQKSVMASLAAVFFIVGCSPTVDDLRLEEALAMAGENRPEMERVLDHFSGDSLKYAAAKFLVRNMPGHYSYADTNAVVAYSRDVDSIVYCMKDSSKESIRDAVNACAEYRGIPSLKRCYDIKTITSDYLIRNIDDAFAAWKDGRWAHHLTFDEFCEYLLPYKVEELQLLDDWRSRLKHFHTGNLKELEYCDVFCNSTLTACKQINNNLHDYMNPDHSLSVAYPRMRIESGAGIPFGTCDNYAVIASAVMMSAGIPIVRDFTPQWAFRSMGHSWNVVYANDGKKIPFSGVCSTPGEPHKLEEKMAKAYRHTYAMNEDIRKINESGDFVPPLFRNVFMKDVTPEYISCKDFTVDVEKGCGKYAYLAVFDDKNWTPIAYGQTENGKATFRNVGLNSMYLVVGYDKSGQMKVMGNPFVLNYDGKPEYVVVSEKETTSMTLKRKYPVLEYVYWYLTRLEGGEFQASNDKDFRQFHTVFRIAECRAEGYEIDVPDSIPPCRYWRYYSDRKGGFCTMAEIAFHDSKDGEPLKGEVIGTEGSLWDLPDRTKEKVFDGDILTFHEAANPDTSWVGMDFGRPVKMNHIYYVGRGDGNSIEKGDEYELMCWKNGTWESVGRMTADGPSLPFEGVPAGGLYLLKDLTKGHDERIFTFEGGKQVWW